MTYVQVDRYGNRPVQVQLDDGNWVPGLLEAARKVEGVWSGLVRYSLKPGDSHLHWFEEGRIRGHVD